MSLWHQFRANIKTCSGHSVHYPRFRNGAAVAGVGFLRGVTRLTSPPRGSDPSPSGAAHFLQVIECARLPCICPAMRRPGFPRDALPEAGPSSFALNAA